MIKTIVKMLGLSKPTPREIAARLLSESEIELVTAEHYQEHYKFEVAKLAARIERLKNGN